MRFLLDANLPLWLVQRGHECSHVFETDLTDASDTAIWNFAQRIGAVIISKDQDFADRSRAGRGGPPVLWLRTGNGSVRDLIDVLTSALPVVEARLSAGETLVEVRR